MAEWTNKRMIARAGLSKYLPSSDMTGTVSDRKPFGLPEIVEHSSTGSHTGYRPNETEIWPAAAESDMKSLGRSYTKATIGDVLIEVDGSLRPVYRDYRNSLRKRLLNGGHKLMPETELLELLLFNAIPRANVRPLADRLLASFGDLNGVVAASKHNILSIEGTTETVFLQLRLVEAFAHRMGQAKILNRNILASWDDLIRYCRTTMAHRETEQFRVIYLNRKNALISDEEQAHGTVNHVPVYPREVAKRALELNASALILVHNHPSGDPTPSPEDIIATEQIAAACRAIDVTLHDHVIIGKGAEMSFREREYL